MPEPLDVDIVQLARGNDAFRREIATGRHSQVVAMTIPAGGEIGEEVHEENDQLLVFVDGEGEAVLDGKSSRVTVYAPPEHAPGTVHQTKAEADAAEDH
jgi:mannose-6-phosphate isomerase-like protein (cupin superfamily)